MTLCENEGEIPRAWAAEVMIKLSVDSIKAAYVGHRETVYNGISVVTIAHINNYSRRS